MAEPNIYKKHSICRHIQSGELVLHSTVRWITEPVGKNTTDYHWDITVELCPLCSGMGFAKFEDLIEADIQPKK